ncbi:MAG: RNA polymerase sigma factor (sigma-70 family) [Desulforhopalus sp.]|jgi:RNA polymerase sigma factor (sigma-70 family)
MRIDSNVSTPRKIVKSVEVIDLLATQPSQQSFLARVQDLRLSAALEQKVQDACDRDIRSSKGSPQLSLLEEKELATEVLLLRHKFTELVWQTKQFNQAALTVIQNIYLFRNRKIFFDPSGSLYEQERQEALHIFSSHQERNSLPLRNTFQHLIIARVWNRIISQSGQEGSYSTELMRLQKIVEQLNTIRNIYVLLTTGLVKKIVSQLGDIYKEGISVEDAWQIGSFGVARAAYRYHHSCGVRFSTYAANWIRKEVQRQTLDCRLIKISTNTIEQYALAKKNNHTENVDLYADIIKRCSCMQESTSTLSDWDLDTHRETTSIQEAYFESKEMRQIIQERVHSCLSPKERDLIKRRFGLSPYTDHPQSVISISKTYGVTRSSIYQLENKALSTLKKALTPSLVDC